MKYRISGIDLDGENKQFGSFRTLKDARTYKRSLKQEGIVGFIQHLKTKKIYN